jgi:hypothetical protein
MRVLAVATAAFLAGSNAARSDEGLWTYDDIPAAKIKAALGFAPDQAWLDHVRLASVLLNGCSAGIVSPNGLLQTNHHCVVDCIESLSAPGQDLNMTPIVARSLADERVCPGLVAEVLTSLQDVTARVKAVGDDSASSEDARQDEMTRIEEECNGGDASRRCEVISLFAGAKYTLHAYRKWSDVRLVLGPEGAAGSFGGDPDNFNFPRFAFDIAYLRLYENGKPAATPNYLKWRSEPLRDGEPVFTSGHPGFSDRATPAALVDYYLDTHFPYALVINAELRGRLIAYAATGAEAARVTQALLFDIENIFKSDWAEHMALQRGIAASIRAEEAELRRAIDADPTSKAELGDAWERLDAAMAVNRQVFTLRRLIGESAMGTSDLFQHARTILRASQERQKPETERLDGYSDPEIADLKEAIAADAPVLPAKEELLLSFWLSKMREHLTADHPIVRKVLGRESPEALAARIVASSKLADPGERKRLFEGGMAAVDASDDPLITILKSVDVEAREVDRRYHEEVNNVVAEMMRRIDAVRIRLMGTSAYPDANGTLRLSYGRVAGWTEPDGRKIEPFTTFAGLLDRATGADPFKLADAWGAAKAKLDPRTILNASTTNDTLGGNSGSPAVDVDGRIVGAMFDGNIHSLGGYYLFDPELNRTVIVTSTALEEGLAKVYGLQRIVDELKQ